ncbi:MAG TPA: CoA transferase, partial [Candidatus Kapabacteria bacterium]|nr:CoA transferase [Candidatus Kapabacteria bacterium]
KANRFELTPLLEEKLVQNTTAFWVEKLNEAGVPSGEILKLDEAVSQPQIEHRNTFAEVELQGIGRVKLFNLTAKFEKTPGLVKTPPPTLSQHTYEILQSIGYSKEEIDDFKTKGIV